MNLKKLLFMLTFFVLLGTTAFAQTTYYVNSVTGLDGYNGLSATVQGGGVGPKLTIQNAVDAAVDGDIISVAGNSLVPYAGAVVITNKTLTFTVTAGSPANTPVLNGDFTVNDASSGNSTDGVTFTGNFYFGNGVTIYAQSGQVRGASYINVPAALVTLRRATNSTTFDAPVTASVANSIDLFYDNANITVGQEWSGTTVINAVTSNQAGGNKLTLANNVTMNGVLTTTAGGVVELKSFTLTLNNPTTGLTITHANAGNITSTGVGNGELKFTGVSATAQHTWGGTGDVPNVRKSSGILLFNDALTSINGNLVIDDAAGNVTFTPSGAQALAIAGSVTHNGSGTLDFDNANGSTALTLTGDLTLNGSGTIILGNNDHSVGGNVLNTGSVSYTATAAANSASIVFVAGNQTVTGSVTNSKVFSFNFGNILNLTGIGNIAFGAGTIAIGGDVTNSVQISGARSSSAAANTNGGLINSGNITFASTTQTVTVTGNVYLQTINSYDATVGTGEDNTTFTNCGNITFASTNGALSFGNVSNTSSGFAYTAVDPMGSIVGNKAGTRTLGTKNITNSSTNTSGNGQIDFGVASGNNTITGSILLDGSAGTGDITFGTGTTTVSSSVTNSKSVSGANIAFTATGNDVTITGDLTNSGASNVTFASTAGNATVNGTTTLSSTGGISFATTTGAIGFNILSVTGTGTLTLGDATNTPTTTVSGTLTFTAGNVQLGTAPKTISFTGSTVEFALGANFVSTVNTNQFTFAAANAQSLNVSSGGTFIWPGHLTVNVTIVPATNAWQLLNGNLMVNGDATFTSGQVNIANNYLFIKGDFANNVAAASSYVTGANGFISMQNGGGPNTVTASGTATFGNFEVDNTNGATIGENDAISKTYTFTGAFNLTLGMVTAYSDGDETDVIAFNNTTTPPTIYRNAGGFAVAPTFTSTVNVTYIGASKTFSNEVPIGGSNKLVNLTIATTGTSTVTANINFEFSGTLTVNSGQTLALVAQVVTANGAVINSYGEITSTTGYVNLNRAAGTTFTATTELPEIRVAVGSSGNIVTGTKINNSTNNDVTLGAGTATLTLTLSGAVPQLRNITTNHANNTLTIGSSMTMSGVLTHNDGTIALGSNNLTVQGVQNVIGSATAAITGTGKLVFNRTAATIAYTGATNATPIVVTSNAHGFINGQVVVIAGETGNTAANGTWVVTNKSPNTFELYSLTGVPSAGNGAPANDGTITVGQNLDLSGAAATIAANVEMNLGAAGTPLSITTNTLTASGTVTLTKGTLYPTAGLKITGNALNLTSNSSVAGAGVLTFQPTTGNTLTATLAGATTFNNLTINGDVSLAGSAGALTITTTLTHTSGLINFADRDIIVGTLTRAAGTYSATTGYLQVNTAFTQGTGFSIPNLRINGAMTIGSDQNFTVTDNLYLNNVTFTHKPAATARLSLGVAAGNIPTVTVVGAGNLDVAPTFAQGQANYVFTGTAATTVSSTSYYWPATAGLANNVTASQTGGGTLTLNADRTINGNLTLQSNILDVATTRTLTMGTSGSTIYRTELGGMTLTGTGALSAANVNLYYKPSAAGVGAVAATVGPEYVKPTVVNNVTVDPSLTLTINSARTIAGDLTANHDVIMMAATTVTGAITVATGKTLTVTGVVLTANGVSTISGTLTGTGSANFSNNVTLGGFGLAGTIGFVGATGQTVTVPTAGANISNLNVNMTGLKPVLNIEGGNLTITTLLTFTNGIVNMGTNTLALPRPTGAVNSGLAFDRSAVTGTNVGHIVGKVSRAANSGDGQALTNGRFEFPVGTLTGEYRPAAITFTPSYVVGNPVSIIVSHVDASPAGTVNLPLDGGNGIKVGNYPNFYWLVSTSPTSLTSTQGFDIDLQANNIGYPYASDQDLRIIRRQDGSAESNGWSMQGTAANYANYQVVVGTDTTVVARTVSGQGGLVSQGSRFSIGVPTRAPSFTAPAVLAYTVDENTSTDIAVTATGNDVGETVTIAKVSGPTWATYTNGVLTLAPGYDVFVTGANTFNVVLRATDSSGMTTDLTITVTVNNVNRAPSFTADGAVALTAKTVKAGSTLAGGVTAIDADGGDLTYTVAIAPALAGTITITAAATGAYEFKPVFADAGKEFDVTITATDNGGLTATTTAKFTVDYPVALGDVDGNGSVGAADASEILKYVVGLVTFDAQQMYAANVNGDAEVGALDAAWVLYYVANGTWPSGAKMNAVAGLVDFGQIASENGVINMPINLTATSGVLSAYTEISINDQVEVTGVTARLPEGWTMVQNVANNKVRIAMAGLTPLTEGTYAVVGLKLKDKEAVVNISGLANLNDQLNASLSAKVREIPSEFALSQNYPNPFNPTTTIKFAVAEKAPVTLNIYNMLGQKVKSLVDSEQEAGFYTVNWDGTNDFGSRVASGIYIYRITAGKFTSTMKMNLLK